jgi:hypothetical protein
MGRLIMGLNYSYKPKAQFGHLFSGFLHTCKTATLFKWTYCYCRSDRRLEELVYRRTEWNVRCCVCR